jgi:DNA-binding NarL/FixJ family response regulator
VSNIWKTILVAPVRMPDRDSHSGLTELRERYPTISIIVLSGQCEAMFSAVQLVCGSPNAPAEILSRDDASAAQPAEKKPAINGSQLSTCDLSLTERQHDVLALMMQGKSNKAICRVLNLAEPTVKNHVTAILKALKVSNRTEAVIVGLEITKRIVTRHAIENPPLDPDEPLPMARH